MASANVGSPMTSCHFSTGSWLVTMVERTPCRSSRTSSRSCRCSALNGESPGWWTRHETTRTVAALPLEEVLRDVVPAPAYQRLAGAAAAVRARGWSESRARRRVRGHRQDGREGCQVAPVRGLLEVLERLGDRPGVLRPLAGWARISARLGLVLRDRVVSAFGSCSPQSGRVLRARLGR